MAAQTAIPSFCTRWATRMFLALVVMAGAVVLSSCAANQQTANTAISPQEEQDRSVCLQHAHRDSGFNEKAFASCMTAKGYKKDKLYPSVTIADAGNPPLSDTLQGRSRTENTTPPPAAPEGPH